MIISELAIFGGEKAIRMDISDMFTWPIITKEIEDAVLGVLHKGAMSDLDIGEHAEAFKKVERTTRDC